MATKSKIKNNYVVMDFETGGLKFDTHAICSFAAVTMEPLNLEIIDRIEFKVRPYEMEYTREAEKVHRLSKTILSREGIKYETAMKEIFNFFERSKVGKTAKGFPVLVGHNLEFDLGFMNFNYEVMDFNVKKSFQHYYIDTMRECQQIFALDESVSYKLTNICERFNITLDDSHTAMGDVLATAELFRVITNLKREISKGGRNLLAESNKKDYQNYQF